MRWFLATITVVLVSLTLIFDLNESLSSCDEVDVFFYIDTASIKHNYKALSSFITEIIDRGSSEHAAFSIAIYGDDINFKMDECIVDSTGSGSPTEDCHVVKISLADTQKIQQRDKERKKVLSILKVLKSAVEIEDTGKVKKETGTGTKPKSKPESKAKSPAKSKSITIIESFTMTKKQKIKTTGKKDAFLKDYEKYAVVQDGRKAHFIFDHTNKLLKVNKNDKTYWTHDSNDELCELFRNIDPKQESLHFLMGQQFDDVDVFCETTKGSKKLEPVKDPLLTRRTFYYLSGAGIRDKKRRESVLGITCPSQVMIPKGDTEGFKAADKESKSASIKLGIHNQWMVPEIVRECHLIYIDHDENPATPDILDRGSYVVVDDDPNDDNTFMVGDYLLSDPKTFEALKKKKCSSPVYKIVAIKHDKNGGREAILDVLLPESPMEYIRYANIMGDVEVPDKETVQGDKNKEERLKALTTKDGKTRRLVTKTWKLLDLESKWEQKWEEEGAIDQKWSTGHGQSLQLQTAGKISVTVGYEWHLKVNLHFEFKWNIFKGTAKILFFLDGSWFLEGKFEVAIEASLKAVLELFNFGHTFAFFIGPVPVVVRPYVELGAALEFKPFKVTAGITCKYAETFKLGYQVERVRKTTPKYHKIKGHKYMFPVIEKSWPKKYDEEECAAKAYHYGSGEGRTCKFFDHHTDKTCRCMGSRKLRGELAAVAGWNAFILNHECPRKYEAERCTECKWGEFWIKRKGKQGDCEERGFLGLLDLTHSDFSWDCLECNKDSAEIEFEIKDKDIWKREKGKENGCTKSLTYNDADLIESCPKTGSKNPMGFDVTITPKIGISLYVVVNVYVSLEITFPVRVLIPVLDAKLVPTSEDPSKCVPLTEDELKTKAKHGVCTQKSQQMYVALSVEGTFEPKLGVEFNVQQLFDELFLGLTLESIPEPIVKELSLVEEPITILDKKYKCFAVQGTLFGMGAGVVTKLNTNLYASCCDDKKKELKKDVEPAKIEEIYNNMYVYDHYYNGYDDDDYYYNHNENNDYHNLRLLNKKRNKFNKYS